MIKPQTPKVNNSKCKATNHRVQVHALIDLKGCDSSFAGDSFKFKLELLLALSCWFSYMMPEHIDMSGLHQWQNFGIVDLS